MPCCRVFRLERPPHCVTIDGGYNGAQRALEADGKVLHCLSSFHVEILSLPQMNFALHRRVREGVEERLREGLQRTAMRKIIALALHFLILCRLFIY